MLDVEVHLDSIDEERVEARFGFKEERSSEDANKKDMSSGLDKFRISESDSSKSDSVSYGSEGHRKNSSSGSFIKTFSANSEEIRFTGKSMDSKSQGEVMALFHDTDIPAIKIFDETKGLDRYKMKDINNNINNISSNKDNKKNESDRDESDQSSSEDEELKDLRIRERVRKRAGTLPNIRYFQEKAKGIGNEVHEQRVADTFARLFEKPQEKNDQPEKALVKEEEKPAHNEAAQTTASSLQSPIPSSVSSTVPSLSPSSVPSEPPSPPSPSPSPSVPSLSLSDPLPSSSALSLPPASAPASSSPLPHSTPSISPLPIKESVLSSSSPSEPYSSSTPLVKPDKPVPLPPSPSSSSSRSSSTSSSPSLSPSHSPAQSIIVQSPKSPSNSSILSKPSKPVPLPPREGTLKIAFRV